jgi:hypothetical protein
MKRFVILVAALVLLSLATPIFAEIELGASLTPASYLKTQDAIDMEKDIQQKEGSFLGDMIFGFHVGYSWWWLFYASWDSYVMPPWWVFSNVDVYRPGFLNLIDLGIRPVIGPIILMAEIGVNSMYIYKQDEDLDGGNGGFGANMRVGAGLKFKWWSLTLCGTSVFVDFDTMADVLAKVSDGNPKATDKLLATIIPSLTFNLHF